MNNLYSSQQFLDYGSEVQHPVSRQLVFTKTIEHQNEGTFVQIEESLDLQKNKECEHVLKILHHQIENENCLKIQYQKGTPLSKLIFFNDKEKIDIIKQLYELDTYLKKNGIIHDNIKPNNIIIVDGKLKLTDFNNKYYMLRNFLFQKEPEYCVSTLFYLSDKILNEVLKYAELEKFKSFGEDKQLKFLEELSKNQVEQNRLYDNQDSQSIALIMLELLQIKHEIGQNCSVKQIIQSRQEQGLKLFQYQQIDQKYIQFIEVQIFEKQVDLSNLVKNNQLINEYIQQNSNKYLVYTEILCLFNEEQLRNYINKTNNQDNIALANNYAQFFIKLQNLLFQPDSYILEIDNQIYKSIILLNHLNQHINKKQNTENTIKHCQCLAYRVLQNKICNQIWDYVQSLAIMLNIPKLFQQSNNQSLEILQIPQFDHDQQQQQSSSRFQLNQQHPPNPQAENLGGIELKNNVSEIIDFQSHIKFSSILPVGNYGGIEQQINKIEIPEIVQFLDWDKQVKEKRYHNQKVYQGKIGESKFKIIAIGNTEASKFKGEIIQKYQLQIKEKDKKFWESTKSKLSKLIANSSFIKHYENIENLDFDLNYDWNIRQGNCIVTTYLVEQKKQKFFRFKKLKIYEGSLVMGLEHNEGKMYDFENNLMYEGEWDKGKKNGKGVLKLWNPELYKNGDCFMYEGNFKNDEFESEGIMYLNVEKTLKQAGYFQNGNVIGWHEIGSSNKVIAKILYNQEFCCCNLRIKLPNCCRDQSTLAINLYIKYFNIFMEKLKKKIEDEGKKLIIKFKNIQRASNFSLYSDQPTTDRKQQKYIFDDTGITPKNIQKFETLEQDWNQVEIEVKLQIFYELMKIMYFLTEKKMEHRNINPRSFMYKNINKNKILLLSSKFRSNEKDAEKIFGKLSQKEMEAQAPYLTEELLLMLKEQRYSDYGFRDFKTYNLADREALALIAYEIFHPDPFRKLRETNLTYEKVLDFRKKLSSEIEQRKKQEYQSGIQYQIDVYDFVLSTISTILIKKELPDQQQFVKQYKQYRNLIPKEKKLNYKNELEVQINKQVFHQQKNSDQINSESPVNRHQRRLITEICDGQRLIIEDTESPGIRNPYNISFEDTTPISKQKVIQAKPLLIENYQSDEENQNVEEIDVDAIDEKQSDDPRMQKFQIEQKQKIGRYEIQEQYYNEALCKVSNSFIIKGKFNRSNNKLINGKITQLLTIKDKTFIYVFENVSAENAVVSIQNQKDFKVFTINGENSKLTKYAVKKNKDNGEFKFKKISQYIGRIEHGSPHGQGIFYDYKNNYMYDGNWQEGQKEGYGRQKILDDKLYQQGQVYEYRGYFKQNLFQGFGRLYMKDDETLFEEGNFNENLQVGFHTRTIKIRQSTIKSSVFYFKLFCQIRIPISFQIQ